MTRAYIRAAVLALSLLVCTDCANAGWPTVPGQWGGTVVTGGGGGAVFPASYYAGFTGWTFPSSQFPIGSFGEDPASTGNNSTGGTLAASGVALGMPIFFGTPEPTGNATDGGQFTAAKNAGAYLFVQSTNSASNTFANVDCEGVTSALNNRCTVGNIKAAAAFYGASASLLGYDLGDEPVSGTNAYNPPTFLQPQQGAVAAAVSFVQTADPTRVNFLGQGLCVAYGGPTLLGCDTNAPAAFAAPALPTFDDYPTLSENNGPWLIQGSHVELSDASGLGAATHGNDADWLVAVGQLNMLSNNAAQSVTKPTIHINASGSDALGYSSGGNNGGEMWIHTTNGSVDITIGSAGSGFAFFSDALMVNPPGGSPLSVATDTTVSSNGLQASTHFASVQDSTHAKLDKTATTTGDQFVRMTGGTVDVTTALPQGTPCNKTLKLCAGYDNSYRDAPEATASQEVMALIHGALGISEFCHDVASASFCHGDPTAAGTGNATIAAAAAVNMAYIHGVFNTYATILQQPATAKCSMQKQDFTTTSSCTDGVMTMATGTAACPGAARLMTDPSNSAIHWLFVMSMRKSWSATNCGATSGAVFTITLSGFGSQVATVKLDKAAQFDPTHSTVNATHTMSSGVFTDTLGPNGLSYDYKVYKIQ